MTESDAIGLERGERFLVLMRHGIGEERSEEKRDFDRSLTREGQARTKQMSRALVQLLPKIDRLVSSPFVRCVQTAMFVAKAYDGAVKVETRSELGADREADGVVELLRAMTEQRIAIVGHEPNLSLACGALTGLDGERLELKRAGFYGIRIASGVARLEWMIAPRVVRRLKD